MNQYNSTCLYNQGSFSMSTKKSFSKHPESLFSMASMAMVPSIVSPEISMSSNPTFYPVDEYKDLSLREILEISDDFLFSGANSSSDDFLDLPALTSSSCFEPNSSLSSFIEVVEPCPVAIAEPVLSQPEVVQSNNDNSNINKKRSRDDSFGTSSDEDEDEDGRRFRPYQEGQWSEKFEELCEYRLKHGDCLVPHTYSENLPLARWVKRQRYQFKLVAEKKPSTMTEDRIKSLEEIGFVWDSQAAAWEERLGELKVFRNLFQHCNVPSNYSENPQLATWVKCQRRQFKLHAEGKPSNMTTLRVQQLEDLGFEWELRSPRRKSTN